MLNIHPALLPAFGGKGLYGKHVHQAVLDYGTRWTGATVHLVDEEYDTGPIVLQEPVPVSPDDTPETLAARVLQVEHRLYPEALCCFAEGRVTLDGRRVRIAEAATETP
jgi:phosphoribosylglycinamide formyltransferase-1